MSKRDFCHTTTNGGYSSNQMVALKDLSDHALIDELHRRGIRLKYIRQGRHVASVNDGARLQLNQDTRALTLIIGGKHGC